MIYADNAATTRLSDAALNAMLPYLKEQYANASSLHSAGQECSEALFEARSAIASCLGCKANEIYFTSGGSEADTMALLSAAEHGKKSGKMHIISTAFEHHAVLNTLKKLKKDGFDIELLPVGAKGNITAQQVEDAIRPDTCLVTVMYANNEIGSVLPVAEIGEVCKKHGVLFHTDAVQAAGKTEIDVERQNIDMLSLSAHKFHGPKGIGLLYARRGVVLQPVIYGGMQERGKRAGTENIPAIVGMARALSDSASNMQKTNEHLLEMRKIIIDGLGNIPHSALNGDSASFMPGIINYCFEGIEGESLLLMLDAKGIEVSSGSACASGSLDPSHVLLAIGRPHEIAHGSLRISLSEYNTIDDAHEIVKAVTETVNYLRSISPVWHDLVQGKREFIL